eukprot:scpid11064/ scgid25239/ Extracellular calcium-sensing receptor; Parathyroid cell calcium-sensing receptor
MMWSRLLLPWQCRRLCITIIIVIITSTQLQLASAKFRPGRAPDVLQGYPVVQSTGLRGHQEADVAVRFYLPFHRHSTQRPTHRCLDIDVQNAVPMAEAVALAFELLRESKTSYTDFNFSLGYDMHDTCASLPPFLSQLENIISVTGKDEGGYPDEIELCSLCNQSHYLSRWQPATSSPLSRQCTAHADDADDTRAYPESEFERDVSHDLIDNAFSRSLLGSGIKLSDSDFFGSGSSNCSRSKNNPFSGPYPKVFIGPIENRLFFSVGKLLSNIYPRHLHVSPAPVLEESQLDGLQSFRTAASYKVQVEALLEVAESYGWKYLAVVMTNDDRDRQLKSILESQAKVKGFCLALELILVPSDKNAHTDILDFFSQLKLWSSITAVVVFADENASIKVWRTIEKAAKAHTHAASPGQSAASSAGQVGDWQWLGFQDWAFVADKALLRHRANAARQGQLIAVRITEDLWAPLPSSVSSWSSVKRRLRQRLDSLLPTPTSLLQDPWLAPVWEELHQCHLTCELVYEAANRSTDCCYEEYNPELPNIRFGMRSQDNLHRANCTHLDATAGSMSSEFLLDRSLQIMNTIFMVADVTTTLVEQGVRTCQKIVRIEPGDPEYIFLEHFKVDCDHLLRFANETNDPDDFLQATGILDSLFLKAESYAENLQLLFSKYLQTVANESTGMETNVRAGDASAGEASRLHTSQNSSHNHSEPRHISSVLNIEQAIWMNSSLSWQMMRIGRVLQRHAQHMAIFDDTATEAVTPPLQGAWQQRRRSVCISGECVAGYRAVYAEQLRTCCFFCRRCPPGTIRRAGESHDSCRHCPEDARANDNQTECVRHPLVYSDLLHGSDVGPAVILGLAMVGVLAVLLTFAAFYRYRAETVVKSADTTLSTALLMTLLASFACVNILIVKASDTVCILQMAVALIWPVVYVSGLAIKTNRLRVVFQQTSKLSRRSLRFLSNEVQLLVLVTVAVLTSGYFVAWGLLSPPSAEIVVTRDSRKLVCKLSRSWMGGYFAWTSVLIGITSSLAFSTRRLPGFFNEAPFLCLASALILACWIILVPAYYFSQQVSPSIILAAIIIAQGYSIFGSLFIRRLYYLYKPSEESSSQFLSSSIGSSYSQPTVPRSIASESVITPTTPTYIPHDPFAGEEQLGKDTLGGNDASAGGQVANHEGVSLEHTSFDLDGSAVGAGDSSSVNDDKPVLTLTLPPLKEHNHVAILPKTDIGQKAPSNGDGDPGQPSNDKQSTANARDTTANEDAALPEKTAELQSQPAKDSDDDVATAKRSNGGVATAKGNSDDDVATAKSSGDNGVDSAKGSSDDGVASAKGSNDNVTTEKGDGVITLLTPGDGVVTLLTPSSSEVTAAFGFLAGNSMSSGGTQLSPGSPTHPATASKDLAALDTTV